MRTFWRAWDSGQKEDSILKMDNRFRSVWIKAQEKFICIYNQIDGLFQSKFGILKLVIYWSFEMAVFKQKHLQKRHDHLGENKGRKIRDVVDWVDLFVLGVDKNSRAGWIRCRAKRVYKGSRRKPMGGVHACIAVGLVEIHGVALAEVAGRPGVSTPAVFKIVKRAG